MATTSKTTDAILDERLEAAFSKFPFPFELPILIPKTNKFGNRADIESYISQYILPAVSKALATSSTMSMIDVTSSANFLDPAQPRWAGKLKDSEDLFVPGIALWVGQGSRDPVVDIQKPCATLRVRCGYAISNKSFSVVAMMEDRKAPAKCHYDLGMEPQALVQLIYATQTLAAELKNEMPPWERKENEDLLLVQRPKGNYLAYRATPPPV